MEAEVASETEEGEDRRLRRKDDGTDARDGRRRVKDMQNDTDDPQAIARAVAPADRPQSDRAGQELRRAREATPEHPNEMGGAAGVERGGAKVVRDGGR